MSSMGSLLQFLQQLLLSSGPLAPLVFILARAISIIVAPIPGIVIDMTGLLIFGWKLAFLYSEVGIMLGATVAFAIGRYFRPFLQRQSKLLQRLIGAEQKLSNHQRFWSFVALRLVTNPLFDVLSYGAGFFTTMSFRQFFAGTLIGNVPSIFLFFYLSGEIFNFGFIYGASALVALLILLCLVRWSHLR